MVTRWVWRRLPAALRRRGQPSARKTRDRVRSAIISKAVAPLVYSPRLSRYEPHEGTREKPRFLFLRPKFRVSGDERSGNSMEEHQMSVPLRAANVAEVVEYYYDLDHAEGLLGDSSLVDLVTQTRPDLMILSGYKRGSSSHPNFDVLRSIRKKCRIPLLVLWYDSSGEGDIKNFLPMAEAIDLNILIDSGNLAEHCPNKSNYIRLWTPTDVRVFRPGDGPRDIPVSFVGTTTAGNLKFRERYLGHLRKEGVEVYQSGGKARPISLEKYAEIIRRSKISLHFPHRASGIDQLMSRDPKSRVLNGRVFEVIFSGSLLIESQNTETPQFFTPMSDYVVFDTKEDLVDKVRYYLEHEDERQQIALNGYQKALKKYNHDEFWAKVMGKLAELGLLATPSNRLLKKPGALMRPK